eukprot:g37667.t1
MVQEYSESSSSLTVQSNSRSRFLMLPLLNLLSIFPRVAAPCWRWAGRGLWSTAALSSSPLDVAGADALASQRATQLRRLTAKAIGVFHDPRNKLLKVPKLHLPGHFGSRQHGISDLHLALDLMTDDHPKELHSPEGDATGPADFVQHFLFLFHSAHDLITALVQTRTKELNSR